MTTGDPTLYNTKPNPFLGVDNQATTWVNKQSIPISTAEYLTLQNQPGYSTIAIKAIEEHIVHTEWVGIDINTPGHYFKTTCYLRPKQGKREIGVIWSPTLQEASQIHCQVVDIIGDPTKKNELKAYVQKIKPTTLQEYLCPICEYSMTLRHGAFGSFWGCDKWSETSCPGKRNGKTGKPTPGTYKILKKTKQTEDNLEKLKNNGDLAGRASSITLD